MTPSEAVREIDRRKDRLIAETSRDLYSELVKAAPVGTPESTGIKGYIGGSFKAAWSIDKTSNGWLISNNMEYASILWDGIRITPAGERGSKQWREGGAPILKRKNVELNNEFKRIKV